MMFSSFGRHIREGVKNIGRNGWMTFASISSVTITLLVLGVFLLLAMNVNYISEQLKQQVEVRVFLNLTVDQQDIQEVETEIKAIPGVKSSEFIPKEEGLEQLQDDFGEQGYLFKGLEKENPLQDAFKVKAVQPEETAEIAETIAQFEQVEDVRYAKKTVENLFTVTNVIQNVGLVFVIGLAFTAMFLISNTIKLTIVARRKEIGIMKLVGATNGFIRWPFFIEGFLLGVLGAIVPILLIGTGYTYLYEYVMSSFFFLDLLPVSPFVYQMGYMLIGIGVFIGIWGSLISVRRFLKV